MNATTLAALLDRPVASVSRAPYAYRTSHRIDELNPVLEDGTRLELLLKHLGRAHLTERARRAKPEFMHDPLREVEAYRMLSEARLGTPELHGSGADWILLEKVRGRELWQVGEIDVWVRVARWLRHFHDTFGARAVTADHLLRYDEPFFRLWAERARRNEPAVEPIVAELDGVIEAVTGFPPTFVHGEFYPSNVIVTADRVAPVDWEMAGIGPGILDLAALVIGWRDEVRDAIAAAYGGVAPEQLDAARLLVALQWLGHVEWTRPPEHAHDWLREAKESAGRLRVSL